MTRIICIACLGLLSSAAVLAQQAGNPGGLSPDTPGLETAKPAADHSNTQDKLFVRQAAIGNQAEVELGRLAGKKAASQPVLDPEHQSVRAKLEKASGKDFDIAYIGSNAADTLPDVMEHLEMAKQQYAMLTSGAPPVN